MNARETLLEEFTRLVEFYHSGEVQFREDAAFGSKRTKPWSR